MYMSQLVYILYELYVWRVKEKEKPERMESKKAEGASTNLIIVS